MHSCTCDGCLGETDCRRCVEHPCQCMDPTDYRESAISSLRVYALNSEARLVLIAVLVMSLGSPIYEMVSMTPQLRTAHSIQTMLPVYVHLPHSYLRSLSGWLSGHQCRPICVSTTLELHSAIPYKMYTSGKALVVRASAFIQS